MDSTELAEFRRVAYGLLAAAFLYPDPSLVLQASQAAQHLRHEVPWAAELGFFPQLDGFLESVEAAALEETRDLRRGYTSLFGSGSESRAVTLVESGYLDPTTLQSGQVMADLQAEYAAAGLSVTSQRTEQADHITVELEFMSFLCGLEQEALEARDSARALDALERQTGFLRRHPCRWIGLLSRALPADSNPRIFSAAAQAARALLAHDVLFTRELAAVLKGEPDDG